MLRGLIWGIAGQQHNHPHDTVDDVPACSGSITVRGASELRRKPHPVVTANALTAKQMEQTGESLTMMTVREAT